MNFASLIQQIKRLIALWIFEALTHEDPKQPTYDPNLFDFEEFSLSDEELEELDDLPPPDNSEEASPSSAATGLLPLYIKLPARIQEEQLDELLLPYAITDPDKAETLRWDILASIGISRDLGATPIDAWLAKTKELSNDNPWITLRGLAAQNLTRRTRNWILWLVGVEHPTYAPSDKQTTGDSQ
jgi:hypothetical protein